MLEKKKILMIALVIVMMVFSTFTPISKIVSAGSYDTLTITFKGVGNVSLDVSRGSYNFTTMYAKTMKNTSATYFEIWNNGTVANMIIDVKITSGPGLTVDEDSSPNGNDGYALRGITGGTIQYQPWYKESDWVRLDDSLAKGTPETFGLRLYISNLTANTTWKTMTVSYRGS
jgi:hypothetical protein